MIIASYTCTTVALVPNENPTDQIGLSALGSPANGSGELAGCFAMAGCGYNTLLAAHIQCTCSYREPFEVCTSWSVETWLIARYS